MQFDNDCLQSGVHDGVRYWYFSQDVSHLNRKWPDNHAAERALRLVGVIQENDTTDTETSALYVQFDTEDQGMAFLRRLRSFVFGDHENTSPTTQLYIVHALSFGVDSNTGRAVTINDVLGVAERPRNVPISGWGISIEKVIEAHLANHPLRPRNEPYSRVSGTTEDSIVMGFQSPGLETIIVRYFAVPATKI